MSTTTATPTTPPADLAVAATTKVKKPESALKSFISGGFGGVCVVLTGHPLDLIKVRMQTAAATAGAASPSVFGMLSNTMAKEGIAGLYRGVSAPLVAVTPMFAVSFWGYDMGQRLVQYSVGTPVSEQGIGQKCLAGGFSGLPTTLLMAPSERIKCLMQINVGRYSSMMDCASQVLKEGGIRSLYKGFLLTLLRDVPGSVAWFGTYEYIKWSLIKAQGMEDTSKLSPLAVLTAGGMAGMACWGVSIPADVLKSRFQTAPAGQYAGIIDVYTTLIRNEGPGALFTGIRPALIRAFPANAACFFGMEVARKALAFMD